MFMCVLMLKHKYLGNDCIIWLFVRTYTLKRCEYLFQVKNGITSYLLKTDKSLKMKKKLEL